MTIQNLLTETVPKELFHYTGLDGLRGILSSHSMYATDSQFLNDTTEIANSLPTVRDVFSSLSNLTNPKLVQTMKGILEDEHSTGFLSTSKSQYFTLSFSTEGDDLQQWRGYGDDTHGVCIGFDLRGIRPPSSFDTMVTFARCVYHNSDKVSLIKGLASAFCQRDSDLAATADDPSALAMEWALWQINNPGLLRNDFLAHYKRKLRAQIEYSVTSFRVDLVRASCHFKSPHFASEKEWRLVLPHVRAEALKKTVIHTRNGRPYVTFAFEGYERLPITSVRLGANADHDAAHKILSETGYQMHLDRSEIPYRSFR